MPIHVGAEVRPMSHDDFLAMAYTVTGIAFSLHNEYGSLFGEKVYKYEIARECMKRGLSPVDVEVPIRLIHENFRKDYFADVLVAGGALFELKVAAGLNDEHRAQTLNYLFILAIHQAKLLNFGATQLEHEFVSTSLKPEDRRQFTVHRDRFWAVNGESTKFLRLLIALLHDWGSFLQLPAYYDAVTYFFGGKESVIREIPVSCDGREVTSQPVHLLDRETAFKLTALEGPLQTAEEHMRRFLHHTKLKAIQWVNLYHHDVTFITLVNDA
jgi:GxxExxY protein